MIDSFLPKYGAEGADLVITGNGFNNATGAQVGGVAAPFLKVSDTEVRISVPQGASTGKITILDPDGNQISADDFIVRQPTAPETTARGREALDAIYLAIAAKNRADGSGVARRFASKVVLTDADDNVSETHSQPSASDVVATEIFQNSLKDALPTAFELGAMVLLGSQGVYVKGSNGANVGEKRYEMTLRRSSAGYQICTVSSQTL